MTARRSRVAAFTLVELLVVITIIGILIALLLPAVQAAREAARRSQCSNHLKQLALGLHNYHAAHGIFPPAITTQGSENPGYYNTLRAGWSIMLLPFIEQQGLYDSFDFSVPLNQPGADDRNVKARGTVLSLMQCPTEINRRTPCSRAGGGWARGSYGANMGLSNPYHHPTYPNENSDYPEQWVPSNQGVMGANKALRIADIHDGTSNTLLLCELRSGLHHLDIRGTWAMGQCGASSVCAYGKNGIYLPNSCVEGADDQQGSTEINNAAGPDMLRQECMYLHSSVNWQSATRSYHYDGVHVALADGSVRFLSDFIETRAIGCAINALCDRNTYGTFQRLIVAGDRLPVDPSKL